MINTNCLKQVSNFALIRCFDECLRNLSNYYNVNMELYRKSEENYELAKNEIIHRFRENN